MTIEGVVGRVSVSVLVADSLFITWLIGDSFLRSLLLLAFLDFLVVD